MHRRQQLVKAILETYRVVVGHHPLLLKAQDRRQVVIWPQRPMGIGRLTSCLAEAAIMPRQQSCQNLIGSLGAVHTGQTQFLDPTVLGCAEAPFDPPLGLRAARTDQIDAQLLQRPAKLRPGIGQSTPFILRLEDAVPIGVQSQRPAIASQPATQKVHVCFHRTLRVEAGQDAAGGVIDHANEDHVRAASLQPVVNRGIHLY